MGGTPPLSPLAPAAFPDLPVIGGVEFATAQAGVKYKGRTDVMLARLAPGTTMAGVFTRSATRSAPVLDCQAKIGLDSTGPAAIVVNSGNSNAFTGKNGIASTEAVTAAASAALGIDAARIFTSSTGVIGEPLPHDRITAKLDELAANLSPDGIAEAAKAIMTTDTYPKGAATEVKIGGQTVKIAGFAKGSGMIAPDMATMLVYLFTDAAVDRPVLQSMVSAAADLTFNCITVDSDTSTSDTLLCAATGASGIRVTENDTAFIDALQSVMLDLAHQVVKDGEGATKFVTIHITGAASDADAKTHGMSIANSPLIKTAIAGEDPNWGRVVMAIGKSGAAADRDLLSIWFGDVLVADKGWRSPDYKEEQGAAHMKGEAIDIKVDLGLGGGTATVWTCDLTHGYISINADYRS
ncbi:bifunctional glutamate N-acetyltransferase/amino-acid acetyltransferase ArgJ [Pseudooceanicola sp. C21-150M6]|uniref:bifunctional glutamate N-acetyltransferase/amino-acid acetyltransferase ArgJ n=1 Tax=Pseudooceanicola sp. C21-150M6 TaxID=3434355 RepID=UPI003D7FFBC0